MLWLIYLYEITIEKTSNLSLKNKHTMYKDISMVHIQK